MHILHIQNVTISNLESFGWSILFFWYIFCFLGTRYRFFQRVTAFLNALPPLPNALPLALPYFYWKSVSFSTHLHFSALPDGLLYMVPHILNGTTKFLYHFQRVTTRYHQIFKKEVYYYLFL